MTHSGMGSGCQRLIRSAERIHQLIVEFTVNLFPASTRFPQPASRHRARIHPPSSCWSGLLVPLGNCFRGLIGKS